MPHPTVTPPVNTAAAAMAMWGKKGSYMGAGDNGQPQDLSLNNKNKEHRNRQEPSRQVGIKRAFAL